jgi:hypothetical protein
VAAQVVVGVSLTLISACGGSDGSTAAVREDKAVATPSCMASLTPTSVPKDGSFPSDWPFPPGTVVTGTEQVPGGGLAVTAQVGAEFEEVLPFMQHDLEDAGFVATQGEAERDDAEATWTGGGYSGTWAIQSSSTCEGATLLQVAAAKQ